MTVTGINGPEECEKQCAALKTCLKIKYDKRTDMCSFITKRDIFHSHPFRKYWKNYFYFNKILKENGQSNTI